MAQQAAAAPTIVKYPRWLIVDQVVTANSQAGSNLQIPNDADFEWWWIAAFRTSNLLKVLIQETGTGRYLVYPQTGAAGAGAGGATFNGMYIDLLAGLVSNNGAFPITVPYVMPGSRVYAHTFTDSSGANNTVELSYIGYALLQIAGGSPAAAGSGGNS